MSEEFTVRIIDAGNDPDTVLTYLIEDVGLEEQDSEEMVAEGGVVRDGLSEGDAASLRDDLEERGASVEVAGALPYELCRVHGLVKLEGGGKVRDIVVKADDARNEYDTLGEDTSDAQGRYGIDFAVPADSLSGVALRVRAYNEDGEVIAESEPKVGPKRRERIDLVLYADSRVGSGPIEGDDLFRFVVIRPSEELEDMQLIRIEESNGSEVYGRLLRAKETGNRLEMIRHAQSFLSSDDTVADLGDLSLPIDELDGYISEGSQVDVANVVTGLFDKSLEEVVKSRAFRRDRRRLVDTFLATTVLPGAQPRDEVIRGIKLLTLLERTITEGEADYDTLVEQPIVLPESLFPLPSVTNQEEASEEEANEESDEADRLRTKFETFQLARRELNTLDLTAAIEPSSLERKETNGGVISAAPSLDEKVELAEFVEDLSEDTRTVLENIGVHLEGTSIADALSRLEDKSNEVAGELLATVSNGPTRVVGVGNDFYVTEDLLTAIESRERVTITDRRSIDSLPGVRTLGMGDLEIVRQQIQSYELGEVSHIENVLEGESKEHMHRRQTTTEETFTFETETTTENVQNLQTTTRFELQQETENTIESETSLEAGVRVTASYGPTVSLEAHGNVSSRNAKSEGRRTAQSYAQDIVERSVNRVQERVREQRTRRVVEEIEDRNVHQIDNSDQEDDDHVIGIYRWVNKLYEAQVFNYGQRFMMEFFVPEPAALYLQSKVVDPAEQVTISKPDPPTTFWKSDTPNAPLRWSDLDLNSVQLLANKYDVSDITLPPAPRWYTSKDIALEDKGDDRPHPYLKTIEGGLTIEEGYRAAKTVVAFPHDLRSQTGSKGWISATIGDTIVATSLEGGDWQRVHVHHFNENPDLQPTNSLPFLLSAAGTRGCGVSLHLECHRTEGLVQEWQQTAYDEIMDAYRRKRDEYQSQLTEAAIEHNVQVGGNSPDRNREIEQRELKRGIISLFAQSSFDIDLIEESGEYPDIDFSALHGAQDPITFIEQAFEWPQMTYVFYPYFWARRKAMDSGGKQRKRWYDLMRLEDQDPLFTQFLQAGAARVIVPVRPDFEQDVLYFLQNKVPWSGQGSPPLTDPRYVSIVEELKSQQGADLQGKPEGPPWKVRLPTSLVKLQETGELPDFTKP